MTHNRFAGIRKCLLLGLLGMGGWWIFFHKTTPAVSNEVFAEMRPTQDEDLQQASGLTVDLQDELTEEQVNQLSQRLHQVLSPVSVQENSHRLYRLAIPATQNSPSFLKKTLAWLKQQPQVESVDIDWVYSIPEKNLQFQPKLPKGSLVAKTTPSAAHPFVPNDPLFDRQWHMQQIRMPEAWSFSQGNGVVVAVVDTGVALVEDLKNAKFVPGRNFVDDSDNTWDDNGHGTHVAGTIAQSTNNGMGVTGVSHAATIMPIKVLSATGSGSVTGIAAGIRWAVDHGANVINMSLGGPFYSEPLAKAVKYARDKGVLVVCAAGNEGRGRVSYPAASPGALAVAATQFDETTTFYSNWGKQIAVAAPGDNTREDQNGDGIPDGVLQNTILPESKEDYFLFMGTSMASPHVAGVGALLYSTGITDPNEVEEIIKKTAHKPVHYQGNKDPRYGAGIVNAAAAVTAARQHQGGAQLVVLGLLGFCAFLLRRRFSLVAVGTATFFAGGLWMISQLVPAAPTWVHATSAGVPLALDGLFAAHSVLLFSAAIPLTLVLLGYGIKQLQPVLVGLCAGYAAVLLVGLLHPLQLAFFGLVGSKVWMTVNGLLCLLLFFLLMPKTKRA